jgi:hypothetical protein
MNASFPFWFPAVWTLFGALFTIFSLALTAYFALDRRVFNLPVLDDIDGTVRTKDDHPASLREVQRNVEALTTALTPHGESFAQTLRALQELSTDFQALALIVRETCGAVTGLTTDSRAPATPVLLEILTELRKVTKGGPKIQRRLRPFSLQIYLKAQAEVLARERMQATPNPFHDLD